MIFSIDFATCTLAIEAKKRTPTAFLHRQAYQIEIDEISGEDAPMVLRAPSGNANPGYDPVILEIRKQGETFLQPAHVHGDLAYFDTREKIEYFLGQVIHEHSVDAYGGPVHSFVDRHARNPSINYKTASPEGAREIIASTEDHARGQLGLAASRYRLVDGVLFQEIAEPTVVLDYQTPHHLRPDKGTFVARLRHDIVRPDGSTSGTDWAAAVHTYSAPEFLRLVAEGTFGSDLFSAQHRPLDAWQLVDASAFSFDDRANYLSDALRAMVSSCQDERWTDPDGKSSVRMANIKLEKTSPQFCALYFEALDLVGTKESPRIAEAEAARALIEDMAASADDHGRPFMEGYLYEAREALGRFDRETPSEPAHSPAPTI